MSVLTGPAIQQEIARRRITVDPFCPEQLNPHSYDVTLGPELLIYQSDPDQPLDVRRQNPTQTVTIPESGLVLRPGMLYLGSTRETFATDWYAAVIEGKSSLGRLGLQIHSTAGYIDCGFRGQITLEITVIHPVRIYAGMRVAQIVYMTLQGDRQFYRGKYQGQVGPVASRSWRDADPGSLDG